MLVGTFFAIAVTLFFKLIGVLCWRATRTSRRAW